MMDAQGFGWEKAISCVTFLNEWDQKAWHFTGLGKAAKGTGGNQGKGRPFLHVLSVLFFFLHSQAKVIDRGSVVLRRRRGGERTKRCAFDSMITFLALCWVLGLGLKKNTPIRRSTRKIKILTPSWWFFFPFLELWTLFLGFEAIRLLPFFCRCQVGFAMCCC
ncbi:hypothetical protein QBC44DRAFT_71957 [Cladorrhinum sp. PSN332]|nr:hypothetical protein QBC44DRAFT_71957 [Cladorrhinum sp. PSN332]